MKGGNPKINLDIKNRIHLQVYPVKDNDIDKFNNQSDLDIDVNFGIFWFINYTDMAVCQFEDGCQLDVIECVTVIKRDPTYNNEYSDDDGDFSDDDDDYSDDDDDYSDDDGTNYIYGYSDGEFDNTPRFRIEYGPDYNFNDCDL